MQLKPLGPPSLSRPALSEGARGADKGREESLDSPRESSYNSLFENKFNGVGARRDGALKTADSASISAAEATLRRVLQQFFEQQYSGKDLPLGRELPVPESPLNKEFSEFLQALPQPERQQIQRLLSAGGESSLSQALSYFSAGALNGSAALPAAVASLLSAGLAGQVQAEARALSLDTAPAASAVFNSQLELPVSSSQWGAAMQNRLVWLVGRGIQLANIHLTPPQLGPLQVRIDSRQEGAKLVFISAHASAREAIEASLPRLRELFVDRGLELIDVDIRHGDERYPAQDEALWRDPDADNGLQSLQQVNGQALSVGAEMATLTLHYGLIDAYV